MMKNVFIIITMMLSGLWGCNPEETPEQPGESDSGIRITQEQFSSDGGQIGKLRREAISTFVTLRGHLDVPPKYRASISVLRGGTVKDFNLISGQKVRQGQTLFTLQSPEYITLQQDYLETKEELAFLKEDYLRQKALVDDSIASRKTFTKAASQFNLTKARYQGLKAQLNLLNIDIGTLENGKWVSKIPVFAPMDGYVSNLNLSRGSYISPQDVTMQIINTAHMHLELRALEEDVALLKEDQQVIFTVPQLSDMERKAEVYLIEPAVDQDNRMVNVHAHIADNYAGLISGMYVEARVETDRKEVWALPLNAVMDSEDGGEVLVLVDKKNGGFKFERVKVETGVRSNEWIEILNAGTLKDKQVVVRGGYDLMVD